MGAGQSFVKNGFFLMVATGVFLSTMDSSMMNIALPSIMRTFSTQLIETEWVVLIYLMSITLTLIIWGQLSDRWGKGRVYLMGMVVFVLGSMACYLASTLLELVMFRCIQGVGAAMMMSTGPAIIKLVFPPDQLGRGLGFIGIATSLGLMSGPVVGGVLISHFSWRAIFFVNVPIGILVCLVGWLLLLPHLPRKVRVQRYPFDWYGVLLWSALIVISVAVATYYKELSVLPRVGVILGLLVLLLYFLNVESKRQEPLLPLVLLRERYYWVAMVTSCLSFMVLFIVLILMPFYLDYILQLPVKTIGLVMMALPATLFVISPLSGWLYDLIGAKHLTTLGLLICCIAVVLCSLLGSTSSLTEVAVRLAVLGMGQAIFLSPNTASVLSQTNARHAGTTSGVLATSRNLGMLGGATMAGLVFGGIYSHFSGGIGLYAFNQEMTESFILAFRMTIILTSLLAAVTVGISSMRE